MPKIIELKAPPSLELFSELVELLAGTRLPAALRSAGPLRRPPRKRGNYWTECWRRSERSERALFVATDNHACAGAVQLALALRQNARHRGEVQKLMVHSGFRRRGIGRALLEALERAATARGRTLLILDVVSGTPGEQLYRQAGWQEVGSVPGYAQSTRGAFEPTTFYYRQLGAAGR